MAVSHSALPRVRERPSFNDLEWCGPDLALDNLRNLINFYDQVTGAALQLGIVSEKDKGNIYREGQAISAALFAVSKGE